MEPLKDNKPWRRVLSGIVGVAFIVWGVISIKIGHITAFRSFNHTFIAQEDPVGFWLVVAFVVGLGIVCVYRGIKGKPGDV